MNDYVTLAVKQNRGFPWPEDSWGLSAMFGDDGWCHDCGTPLREQSGSMILQRHGFKSVRGAWVPNWRLDAICLDQALADEISADFDVELKRLAWYPKPPGKGSQLIAARAGESWFDPDELRAAATKGHGGPGEECTTCGTWRWRPLSFKRLPALRITGTLPAADVIASPEQFGDGWRTFRQILVRRELAVRIATASPRDFVVREVS